MEQKVGMGLDIDFNKLLGREVISNYENSKVKEVEKISQLTYFRLENRNRPNSPWCERELPNGYEGNKSQCQFTTIYTLDYCIKNNIIIHTETEAEYNYVLEIIKDTEIKPYPGYSKLTPWEEYGDDCCINLQDYGGYSPYNFYKKEGCTIISAVWFILDNLELLSKEEKVTTMSEKQCTVSRKFIGEIYSKVCTTYQREISSYFNFGVNLFRDDFILNYDKLNQWILTAKTEKPEVYKILIDKFPDFQSKEIDLSDKSTYGNKEIFRLQDGHNSLLSVRNFGSLKDKSIYLNINYNWEIVRDAEGINCLVPTKK